MIYKVQVGFHKEFLKINGEQINIGIKIKPNNGEANKGIIKELAKYFGMSTSLVHIRSGHKSREKIIEVLQ